MVTNNRSLLHAIIKFIDFMTSCSHKPSRTDFLKMCVFFLNFFRTTQINILAHVCPALGNRVKYKNDFVSESIYNVIVDMAPNFEYTMQKCWWKQQEIKCSEYFSPVLIHQGLCFSFNALNSHEMYRDEYVKKIWNIQTRSKFFFCI